MTVYELLNKIIKNEKYELSSSRFEVIGRAELSDADKVIFDLLKNVSSLGETVHNDRIEFCPMFVMSDGRRTFSVDDISEDEFTLLSNLEFDKLPLILRARIADILWVTKKNYKCAIIAANSNWELFKLWYKDDDNIGTLDKIRRAVCISGQIKLTEIYNEISNWVLSFIGRESVYIAGFFSLRMMELFTEQKSFDSSVFIPVLDEIINRNADNVSITEQAYELKSICLFKQKKNEDATRNNIFLADYYVKYAEDTVLLDAQGALRAVHFYQKAIMLYRNNGETQRGEQAHRRLVEIQKDIPKIMVPFSVELNIEGIVENIETNMKDLTFEESVIRITQMLSFDNKDDIKQRVVDEYNNSPISHMFGKNLINAQGQTVLTLPPLDISNVDKNQGLLELHMHQNLLEKQKMAGDIWVKNALRIIREKYTVDNSMLDFLIDDNAIIPAGRDRIIRSGVRMFLNGEFYEAMHILAPQTENIFRDIARQVGGLTVTLQNDGSSMEKVLSSIFSLPELLDCYDNDILFTFKGLLNEQAGANIRNEIAHGIISEYACSSGVCLYFGAAFIKLLAFTSPGCFSILRKSEKLKHFETPKKDALKVVKKNNP